MAYFRTRSLVFLLIVFSSILFACAPNAGKDGSSGSDGADYVPPEGSTAPQAPSSLTATATGSSQIDLSWSFNSGSETGFNVQRMVAGDDWETIGGTTANVTIYQDTTVECEKTYSYRALAYNDFGESSPSSESSATADYCEIDAPTDLTALLDDAEESGEQRAIILSWSQGPGELPGVVTTYEIYRKTYEGIWSDTPLETQPAETTTYTDDTATCGNRYQYRARAVNDHGEEGVKSAFSNTATTESDVCPLLEPTNLVATLDQAGKITLTWDINDPDATGYLLQRSEVEARADWVTIADLPEGTTSFDDETLECETVEYDYRIQAYNRETASAWVKTLNSGKAFCVVNVPGGLYAEVLGAEEILLSWVNNADNQTGFYIYRDEQLIATLNFDDRFYNDSTIVCETTYRYRIKAFNANVESEYSDTAVGVSWYCPVSAPTGLTSTTGLVRRITLNWTDNSNEEQGYHIQRALRDSDDWRHLNAIPADATSYEDDSATCESVEYDYRVQAFDAYTTSDWSNTAAGSSLCPVEAPSGLFAQLRGPLEIELTWYNNADNQTGFKIYRDGSPIGVVDSDVNIYNDVSVACETVYRYFVTAFSDSVESADSLVVGTQTLYCPVADPTNLVATGADQDRVDLTWEDNADNETNFEILRRELGETAWQTIATEAANTELYSDTTVECLHIYEYIVFAYNDNRSSSPTDFATGRPTGCTPIRPRPVVDTLAPSSHLAMLETEYCEGADSLGDYCRNNDPENRTEDATCDCGGLCWWDYTDCGTPSKTLYQLRINGSGIAADTQALVGDLSLSCLSNASECQADDLGEPDPEHGTCATFCVVDLPTLIMRNADTYMVRLSTPDPVFAGLNISEDTLVFSVVAPLPEISRIWPRGVYQKVDADGNPITQEFDIGVWGEKLMDNVQFRLGSNFGKKIESDAIPGDPDLVVRVSTQNLVPRNDSYGFTAINPSPGGGDYSRPFGLNPLIDDWTSRLSIDLRSTRSTGPGSLIWQRVDLPRLVQSTGMAWGGNAGWTAVRDEENRLMTRMSKISSFGILPLPIGSTMAELQDDLGFGPDAQFADQQVLYQGGDGTFGAISYFSVGERASCAAIGDLNADGKPDVVTSNKITDDVTILLGEGDGTFGVGTDLEMGNWPMYVALGDLNGDGILDMATANNYDDNISIRIGDGDGGFGEKVDFTTGMAPTCIAICDLNADGMPDLAASNYESDDVSIRFGTGDGGFESRTDIEMGDGPWFVAAGDLDGDGMLDLVAVDNIDNAISIRLGIGEGSFGERTQLDMGQWPRAIAIGDLNNDGVPDLATANNGSDDVSVRLGNGDGTFTANTEYDVDPGETNRPGGISIGDLNADGVPDIVTANYWSDEISLLIGNGDGTFGASAELDMGWSPEYAGICDLNSDGAPDLLATNGNELIAVRLGNGQGAFKAVNEFKTGDFSAPEKIAVGDLNGDGNPDLAAVNILADTVSILLGAGNGNFGAKTDFVMGSYPRSVALGFLNGDFNLDMATSNFTGDNVSIRMGIGDGTFGPKTDLPVYTDSYPTSVAIEDMDGDGSQDLLTSNFYSDDVSLLLGHGDGNFDPKLDVGMGDGPEYIAIGLLNNDATPDIVTANRYDHNVSIRLGNGDGTFGDQTNLDMGLWPNSVAIDDLNSDSAPDIVSSNRDSDDVSIRFGNGDGTFGEKTDIAVGDDPYHVAIGDINGDGALDIATANEDSDDVVILLGDGMGNFSARSRLLVGDEPRGLALSDLDGDDAMDIVTANGSSDNVSVRLLGIPGIWHQDLTDFFSDDAEKPWLMKYAQNGFTELDVHQAAQTVTKVGVRVFLEWATQPVGSVDLGLTAPDGQMVDLGSFSDFTSWPDAVTLTSWRLNKTFREYDFNGELGIAGLIDLHGLQPTDYWTLSIDNQTGAPAEVKKFTVITDGEF